MRRHRQNVLRNELQAAGATSAETDALLPLADSLRLLRHAKSDAEGGDRVPHSIRRFAMPTAYVLIGIMVSVFTLALAQAASPNSWLFSVQKSSDNVAIWLHPQYREVVMMKRADQVNELVATHASDRSDISALADYMKVAAAYKGTPYANYTAFHYCESRLSQAAKTASPQVSHAIQSSLDSLDAA